MARQYACHTRRTTAAGKDTWAEREGVEGGGVDYQIDLSWFYSVAVVKALCSECFAFIGLFIKLLQRGPAAARATQNRQAGNQMNFSHD